MIIFDEIQVGDVVKINTIYDEIEEELYANVVERLDTTLIVKYYIPTSKVYKGATVYVLDNDIEGVPQESLTEHYIKDTTPFESRGDLFYIPDETLSECSNSDVEDMSESEEEDEEDFVVPDGTEHWVPPPDSREVDASWNSWVPPTIGSKKFKDVVDRIEELARNQEDQLHF